MDGMLDVLKHKLGLKDSEKISFSKLSKYVNAPDIASKNIRSKDKIAVIYATGGISGSEGDAEHIGSDKISETIRKA